MVLPRRDGWLIFAVFDCFVGIFAALILLQGFCFIRAFFISFSIFCGVCFYLGAMLIGEHPGVFSPFIVPANSN